MSLHLPAWSRLLLATILVMQAVLPTSAAFAPPPPVATPTEEVVPVPPSTSDTAMPAITSAPRIALQLTADPTWLEPGATTTFTVSVANTGTASLTGLVITDTLPAGLAYVAQSAVSFDYSARDRRLTWQAPPLAAGTTLTGSFQARVQGLATGTTVTNTVTATAAGLAGPVSASAALDVVSQRADETWITADQGGLLRSADDRVLLRVPPNAVPGRTRVRYAPRPAASSQPAYIGVAFTLNATTEADAPVRQFAAPLVLSYRVTPAQAARLTELTFYHLDETAGIWRPIPTRPDPTRGVLVAAIDHFSTLAVGNGPQPEPPPGITGVKSQLFTGALQVSYPLATLPGPGGLAPRVSLDYSTRSRSGAGHHQVASWGWDVTAGGYILKTAEFVYMLVLDGVAHEVHWNVADNSYRSLQDPYLQIKRTAPESLTYTVAEYFAGVVNGVDQFVAGPLTLPAPAPTYLKNGEGWDVTTRTGSRYHFAPAAYWRPCGANGYLHDFQKWVVTQITDTNPGATNQVKFTYEYEGTQMSGGCSNNTGDQGIYLRSALLKRIAYGVNDAFTVEFAYAGGRPDRPENYADTGYWFRAWTHKELSSVTMQVSGAVAWRYGLQHGDVNAASGPESRQRVLMSITRYGKDGVSALPATTYGYDAGNMGLLTSIANGYGGNETISYTGTDPECRVTEERLAAGTGDPQVVTQYAYPPLAGHPGPTSWDGAAGGYAYAEATLVGSAGPTVVKHWHHVATDSSANKIRVGRAYQTETWQGNQLLQRVQQEWGARYLGTGGTGAAQEYHFVGLTERREWRSDTANLPASRTGYQYDSYGNVSATYEYGGVNLPLNASFEDGLTGWSTLGNGARQHDCRSGRRRHRQPPGVRRRIGPGRQPDRQCDPRRDLCGAPTGAHPGRRGQRAPDGPG